MTEDSAEAGFDEAQATHPDWGLGRSVDGIEVGEKRDITRIWPIFKDLLQKEQFAAVLSLAQAHDRFCREADFISAKLLDLRLGAVQSLARLGRSEEATAYLAWVRRHHKEGPALPSFLQEFAVHPDLGAGRAVEGFDGSGPRNVTLAWEFLARFLKAQAWDDVLRLAQVHDRFQRSQDFESQKLYDIRMSAVDALLNLQRHADARAWLDWLDRHYPATARGVATRLFTDLLGGARLWPDDVERRADSILDLQDPFKSLDRWSGVDFYLRALGPLPGVAHPVFLALGGIFRRLGRPDDEVDALRLAVAAGHHDAEALRALAQAHEQAKEWGEAEGCYRRMLENDGDSAEVLDRLALVLRSQNKWWQEAEVLQRAVALDETDAGMHFRLGEALEAMEMFRAAAASFSAATALDDSHSDWFYRLGMAEAQEGHDGPARPVNASVALRTAIRLDTKFGAGRLGIGMFHARKSRWVEAQRAFAEKAADAPWDAPVHAQLAVAARRCFDWAQADRSWHYALTLDPQRKEWLWQHGGVLERLGRHAAAAQAYRQARALGQSAEDCAYRVGLCLTRQGEFEAACAEFATMTGDGTGTPQGLSLGDSTDESPDERPEERPDDTPEDAPEETAGETPDETPDDTPDEPLAPPQADDPAADLIAEMVQRLGRGGLTAAGCLKIGAFLESRGHHAQAVVAYAEAVDRQDEFSWKTHHRLGLALMRCGRWEQACRAFAECRIFQTNYGLPEERLQKDARFRRQASYAEYVRRLPLRENVILYESFHGATVSCNPYALYRHLVSRPEFAGFRHVWARNDDSKLPYDLVAGPNAVFIRRNSDQYLRYLASAKYLINNVSFPEFFACREGQVYLNTWHGTPIKFLGKDIKDEFMAHANVARNFLQATHILSQNAYTTDILLRRYDISNLYAGEVLEMGYPRLDLTLNCSAETRQEVRSILGAAPHDKVVLYAPTWRGDHNAATFDTERLVADLKALERTGHRIVFRGHHKAEKLMQPLAIDHFVVPSVIDTNALLAAVDVLITDYSSVAIDFLVTRKPIVYYAYDLEDYLGERGLYFPLTDLPGTLCRTQEELVAAVTQVAESGRLEGADAAIERFCRHDDGDVSRRVVDAVFAPAGQARPAAPAPTRKSVVFYLGALMPNGILTSWMNLVQHLDKSRVDITLVIDPKHVASQAVRLEQFRRLPDCVQVIGKIGDMAATLEERWVADHFSARHALASEEKYGVLNAVYEREFNRIFGRSRIDALVHFEGYNKAWQTLFSAAPRRQVARKVMYQHNDKHGEWVSRFPYLRGVFNLYPRFDKLVSVSRSICELNRHNIAEAFHVDPARFDFAENVQAPEEVLARSEAPLLDDGFAELAAAASHRFINIARLSVEKGQDKLIRAFRRVCDLHPAARLFIVGDGPLKVVLRNLIVELSLQDNVFLLGFIDNPFPYLKRADCFVMPSNHEGQPMVLFEAMILGKPIVATDIVGNHDVLAQRDNLLVDNSVEGLADGMLAFIDGKVVPHQLDIDTYQAQALEMFYEKVVGM